MKSRAARVLAASRRAALLAGLALLPAPAPAATMCGDMLVTLVRLTGTVRALERLGPSAAPAVEVGDLDPRYAVTIRVDAVEPNLVVERGDELRVAVHSPARTFGWRTRAGSVRELELELATCEGAFWNYFALRRRAPDRTLAFEGTLEVGRRYRAGTHWDAEAGTVLDGHLDLPFHHEGEIEFLDPEVSPDLGPDRRSGSMEFVVLSRRVRYVAERTWLTTYTCRVVG